MLRYQCRECGKIKDPDGQGCKCGASHASLKVVKDEKPATKERQDLGGYWNTGYVDYDPYN